MNIAFDASDLCTARADGTTRYTRELLKRLPALGNKHNWHCVAPCEKPQAMFLEKNVSWRPSPWPKYWTQLRLPFDLFRLTPDVLFMPIQQLPLLRRSRVKTVAVIHDLAFHVYPEQFTYKDWLLLHIFSAQVAREADYIIAVSQGTADDIARIYGRTRNVHVVHHGVDHDMFRVFSESEQNERKEDLIKKYPALKNPYIAFVGQIQPRKNIVRLVEAFELLKEQDRSLQLVIAGGHGWLKQPILDRIATSSQKESIHVLDGVSDTYLPALYANAEVFTLPTLYEGFGMPVLEAMACGTPVVTSNVSCMPEVAGDAAVLVDPLRVEEIAAGITEARARREELIALGLQRAKEFTWDKTARETLAVIDL